MKGNDYQSEHDQTRINEIERRERQRKSDQLNFAKEEMPQQEGTDRKEVYIHRQNIILKEGYYKIENNQARIQNQERYEQQRKREHFILEKEEKQ